MMREGTLFEITKDHLETGLKGYPAGYCVTSHLDPQKGLSYVGRPAADLALRDPIEVIYLLYHGEAGSGSQVSQFYQDISKRSFCKEQTLQHILALPREGNPMDVFAAAILIAGMFETTGDYKEDSLNVIAKIPQIAATVINRLAGWGDTPAPKPELGFIENFAHMLQMPQEKGPELLQALRIFAIVSLDNGGGDLAAFVGKTVASGWENMYGSLAAAMTALAGKKEGLALQQGLAFVQGILKDAGENGSAADYKTVLQSRLEQDFVIPGFGHDILRTEDSRASVCYQFCQKHFSQDPLVKIAHWLRSEGPRLLQEKGKILNLYPHIDAISGVMLTAAGFPYPEYYTVLLGMARCVGIAMQIVYERVYAREGKGLPVVKLSYLYKHRI